MRALSTVSVCVLVIQLFAGACDSGTDPIPASISVLATTGTVTVGQGQTVTTPLTVTRTNFSGRVDFAIENLPPGVTGSFSPASVSGDISASMLFLAAATTASIGTSIARIVVSGSGIQSQSVPVTLSVTVGPNFSLTVQQAVVGTLPGGSATFNVNVVRTGGFSGAVAFSTSALPSGITAKFTPAVTTENATVLTLTSASSVPTSFHTVTVRANAPALAEQTAQVTLQVFSANAVSYNFCGSELPIWFAHQSDGGAWTRVLPSGRSFIYPVSGRGAIAYVFASAPQYSTRVTYASADELRAMAGQSCIDDTRAKGYTGTVSPLSATQRASVRMGTAAAEIGAFQSAGFQLTGVAQGPVDLFAVRSNVSAAVAVPERIIQRRAVDLPNFSVLPRLVFDSSEAFAPVTATAVITLNGVAREESYFGVNLMTESRLAGVVVVGPVTGTSVTLFAVPESRLASNELHAIYLVTEIASGADRGHTTYVRNPGAVTLALGPAMSMPSVSTAAALPYPQLRSLIASQPEYGSAVTVFHFQQNRGFQVLATAGYHGGTPATWDLLIPDFGPASGFDSLWALNAGTTTSSASGFAVSRPEFLFAGNPRDGDFLRSAHTGFVQAGQSRTQRRR